MGKNRYILIVGCGRLGAMLANRFSQDGHSVVIIDHDESAFAKLSTEFSGFRLEGDAVERSVLLQAKIEKADVVIAATRKDNVNLMVAQVAKQVFQVPRVVARVYDFRREEVYRRLGVETVCPTQVAASLVCKALQEDSPA